ncbi:MAG: response regulator transcription factor [Alphaproteobacteria bacterium]
MPPILVIEDNSVYRGYLQDALAAEGVETRLAESGREALQILKSEAISGVVADVIMPEMDGIELVRAVRQRHGRLPILVLSGHSRDVADVYLKAALAVGATLTGVKGEGDRDLLRELLAIIDFHQQIQRRAGRSGDDAA